ncbi:MAG: 2,3-butanediol dehydrogenase [Proteobacteria bacterium]|nr:2,3-butanediol dehydrogenase [Pseudomonadota bacterium]MBU1452077.1 2,3-butanediol dehydrogenase [Pseudomonadota bacterium]MBU2467274.1 2,3-butanediol dehydrogenase [Pseudomonadota bacterium]MBU2517359.1 2,3-butanediol dehydrogenase [Pseudomonadota bacterium]
MAAEMQAALWRGAGDLKVERVPMPSPGPGEVRLKVKVCGICGSDLHEFREGPFLIPSRPHPLTGRSGGPLIPGHEFTAEVDTLGPGVVGWQPGDRVTVNCLLYCGQCVHCRQGHYNMCLKLGTVAFASDGAFAQYLVVPAYTLHGLPVEVSDDMGALVEPLAVAVRVVKRSRLRLGQSAVVVGAGPIGLLVLQVALAAGASRVLVVEPMAARREVASRLGASAVIDPTAEDAGKAVAALTDNQRADVAFDCVGSQASFDTALKCTGRRAVICVAGLALKPISVPFLRLWGHEKEITFSTGYEDEFPAAIALLADGRVKVQELISDRIALGEIVEKGYRPLMEEPDRHLKVLVYPE